MFASLKLEHKGSHHCGTDVFDEDSCLLDNTSTDECDIGSDKAPDYMPVSGR